ncbi:MAG: endo-1,4-beta-xylanase [Bacteroidota bacterium]
MKTIMTLKSRLIVPGLFLGAILITSCGGKKDLTLKEAFADKFLIGAAVNGSHTRGFDTASVKLLDQQFNSITEENSLKWEKIHPQPGKYSFDAADRYVEFGEEHGMYIVGHVLVWHSQTPAWVFRDEKGDLVNRDTLLARMKDHIQTVVGRYKGRINSWDVVNEAIDDAGGMRKSLWYQIIGEDYVAKAFEYAHEADPDAVLIYNDYSLPNENKRNEAVRLIRSLQEQGIHVDGIGMQGHYLLNYPDPAEMEKSIEAFAALGVQVMITEMDITVLPRPNQYMGADISVNYDLKKELDPYAEAFPDSMQTVLADRYAELFRVFVKHSEVIGRVTFWAINDRQSWLNYWPIRGRKDYPVLFDRDNKPKKAFYSVIKTARD